MLYQIQNIKYDNIILGVKDFKNFFNYYENY